MRPLAELERFFERLFERPTARLFRARLQPIQIQRRIERAMENERLSGADGTIVPNRFVVHLSPADMTAIGEIAGSLAAELADAALTFARAHRYNLADRPQVELISDPEVGFGEVHVAARYADPRLEQKRRRAAAAEAGPDNAERGEADEPDIASHTAVFQVPVVTAPIARLREMRPDGSSRQITLDGRPLTIGRAGDNALVLADARVSRHHARLQARRGALVLTDLGSTNGSRVNGIAIDEVVLGEGDRIQLGDTILIVESVPAA
jgi:hypothetical protein